MFILTELLSKKNFNNYIEDNELLLSKTKLAKKFGISRSTLLRWMRKKGFGRLIEEKPKHLKGYTRKGKIKDENV